MDLEGRYRHVLIDLIRQKIPGCRIWLFGSRARKTHRSGSDFDLAIDAGRILQMREIFAIKEAIEETTLPVFVDIVDINNVSSDFLDHIKKEWIVWAQ